MQLRSVYGTCAV